MKLITHLQDFENLLNRREIYFATRRLEGGIEEGQGIKALLGNPLSFSFSDVGSLANLIEDQEGTLDGEEQHLFTKLVNYHLVRLENEGEKSIRSRTLFAIFRRPGLSQFLTPQQRQSIEFYLSRESRELEKIAGTKVNEWKPEEAIRVARSYRFVRNRLNTVSLKIDKKTRNTGDNLKIYAEALTQKTTLNKLDKLFLVELKRIFSDSGDWKNLDVFAKVNQQANEIEKKFKETLNNPSKNIPADAQYYWDVLVPDTPAEARDNPKLVEFLNRSAEVESLQAILAKDKTNAAGSDASVPLLLSFEEYSFLKNLAAGGEVITLDIDGEASGQVEGLKAEKQILLDSHSALEQQRAKEETTLKRKNPVELKAHPDLPEAQKTSFNEAWLNVHPDQVALTEGETPTEAHTLFAAYKTWRDTAIKEILNTSNTLSETAIAAKKTEAEALNSQIEEAEKAQTKFKASLEIYENPSAKAQEGLNNYKKYFKARLKSGRLLATDFDLIAHLDDTSELLGSEGIHIKTLIDDTREVIGQALRSEFNIKSLEDLSEQDLAKADKFLSYEAVLKGIVATKERGETNELLKVLDARDAALDARQLLSSVVLNVREKILTNISSQQTRNSGAYNEFLDHYSRQHHAINKTDRVEKMLSFTTNMEKQKKEKVGDVYEHAYEKVSSLFANAEAGAIKEGLNKILKTEISSESTFKGIKDAVGNAPLIHRASKSQIDNWKSLIVLILQNNVTAENNDSTHLNTIAGDLLAKLDQLSASEVAKEALQEGVKQIEITDEDNLAVSDRLELAKRTRLIYLEVTEVNEDFQRQLSNIQTTLDRGESADQLVSQFQQTFKGNYLPRLSTLKNALVAECDLLLGGNSSFGQQLGKAVTGVLQNLKLGIDQLEKTHNDPTKTLDSSDIGFKTLSTVINSELLPLFNLDSGTLAKKEDIKLSSTLENSAETHAFVRDVLEVLTPGGAEKAKIEYEKKLKGYEKIVENFKESWEGAKKRLEKDLKKYNNEEFSGKHQLSKEQARKILSDNSTRVKDADWTMNYFSGGEENYNPFYGSRENVFDRWLEAYEDPQKQPAALSFMNNFKELEAVLGPEQENFAKESDEMKAFAKDFDNNKPTLWFKKKYKLTVSLYSLKSIYMMGKQFWEYWSKFTERKNDKMAADLGSKIFGNSKFGREFARDSNKKQDERVSDFKDVHKSSDYQELFEIISKANNAEKDKDEVQAVLEQLMDKGLMRWDSADFLQMLGRLQDGIMFALPGDIESYAENPAALKEKIGQAVTAIWDRSTWEQWQADLPSKYESKMKSFEREYKEQIQKGGVETYIITTLEKWAAGEIDPNFERAKYEQFLYMAFQNGEMNGGTDKRWFYLIKGLTLKNPRTGETILSPEALAHLGALQSNFPFVDALDDKQGAKKNGRVVPNGTPGAHDGIWDYNDIQAWSGYFSDITGFDGGANSLIGERSSQWLRDTLIPTFDAKNRMNKIQHKDVDHDDMWSIPLLIDSEQTDRLFSTVSDGGSKVSPEASIGFISGFEENLDSEINNYLKTKSDPEMLRAVGFGDYRDTTLRRIGMMIKAYFMAINKLANNYHLANQTEAAKLGKELWADDNANKLQTNKAKIDQAVKVLTGENFESLNNALDGNSLLKTTDREKLPAKEKSIATAMNSNKFSDVDAIESFIGKYESGGFGAGFFKNIKV